MLPAPIVRYMLLCEGWEFSSLRRRITIIGLLSNIAADEDPSFPLVVPELCVFLALTEARGRGEGCIVCIDEAEGTPIFATPPRSIDFADDPLDVIGLPFRIQDCPFPRAGMYVIQFFYDGVVLDERPLRLR